MALTYDQAKYETLLTLALGRDHNDRIIANSLYELGAPVCEVVLVAGATDKDDNMITGTLSMDGILYCRVEAHVCVGYVGPRTSILPYLNYRIRGMYFAVKCRRCSDIFTFCASRGWGWLRANGMCPCETNCAEHTWQCQCGTVMPFIQENVELRAPGLGGIYVPPPV